MEIPTMYDRPGHRALARRTEIERRNSRLWKNLG
jgi:hypothetical protein